MSSKFWVTEPNQYLEPKLMSYGFGARKPTTVNDQFKKASVDFKDFPALGLKRATNVSSSRCF
jgi:hypothetical protein